MSRRVLLRSLVLVIALGAVAFLFWPASRDSRVTRVNFERIQDGMTEAEVNTLLGGPPGEYRSEPGFFLVGPGHIPRSERSRGGKLEVWYCTGLHIEVLYDKDARVVGKHWLDTGAGR